MKKTLNESDHNLKKKGVIPICAKRHQPQCGPSPRPHDVQLWTWTRSQQLLVLHPVKSHSLFYATSHNWTLPVRTPAPLMQDTHTQRTLSESGLLPRRGGTHLLQVLWREEAISTEWMSCIFNLFTVSEANTESALDVLDLTTVEPVDLDSMMDPDRGLAQ